MEHQVTDCHADNLGAKVILLDLLSKGDKLSVQTLRSNYQFSVVDPCRRKGTLTGGALGDQILEAFLSGTISEDRTDPDSTELKTGKRAVFFLDFKNQAQRLTTSVITDIALEKDCVGEERVA